MYLVMVTLAGEAAVVNHIAKADAIAAFRAVERPEDQVEHVAVCCGSRLVHIGLYLLAANRESAVVNAFRIARRAIDSDRRFDGYRLVPDWPTHLVDPL